MTKRNDEFFDNDDFDLCYIYDINDDPPQELLDEWARLEEENCPKPTLANTAHYVRMPDGTVYFYCGNTRIKVSEHFAESGKSMDNLIENVIRHVAGKGKPPKTSPIY